MVTDKEVDDFLLAYHLIKSDLTKEELLAVMEEIEWINNGTSYLDGVLASERLVNLRNQRFFCKLFLKPEEYDKLREMIARCTWTFAKTMPWCPHEYIVREKCPLSDAEFLYFVDKQRNYGMPERWGKYIFPYLHIDGYKYWTMGDTYENTIIINRAKE